MDVFAPIILSSIVWIPALFAFYWVIRLAVRHGTLDAYRTDRVDQRIEARMVADARRSQTTYGPTEPE